VSVQKKTNLSNVKGSEKGLGDLRLVHNLRPNCSNTY